MKKFFSYLFLITIFLSFSYGLAFSVERDLKFLKELSNEELSPIVAVIKNEKDNKLSEKEKNNPQKYLDRVIENLEKVAINELNIKDSKSVSYKQILETVCKKQNIPFENNISTQELGTAFVKHAFVDTVDKMSKKQRESLVGVLREAMNVEEFEVFLEDVGGTNGLLVSSGEKISNLLFSGYLGPFMTATCLVSDIANVVDLKQSKETDEQQISYTGIVPALTYIESLRIVKEQAPGTEEDSDILGLLIVVSIPVICVLLLFILIDPKKRAIFFKFIKFLFICLFVAIVLLLVMLVVETAENYIVVGCILLISLLLSWLFSIQRKIITKRLNKSILKNAKTSNISKEQNVKEKIISKIICPKCNAQNSKTNYSCTNCHYVFADENQEVKANEEKKESEIKTETNSEIKEKIETFDNKKTEQTDKPKEEATEISKDENVQQKDKTENETKEKSETFDTKEVKEANKIKKEVKKTLKYENIKQKPKKKKKKKR